MTRALTNFSISFLISTLLFTQPIFAHQRYSQTSPSDGPTGVNSEQFINNQNQAENLIKTLNDRQVSMEQVRAEREARKAQRQAKREARKAQREALRNAQNTVVEPSLPSEPDVTPYSSHGSWADFNYFIAKPGSPGDGIFFIKEGDIVKVFLPTISNPYTTFYWFNLADNTVLRSRDVTGGTFVDVLPVGSRNWQDGMKLMMQQSRTALTYLVTPQESSDINQLLTTLQNVFDATWKDFTAVVPTPGLNTGEGISVSKYVNEFQISDNTGGIRDQFFLFDSNTGVLYHDPTRFQSLKYLMNSYQPGTTEWHLYMFEAIHTLGRAKQSSTADPQEKDDIQRTIDVFQQAIQNVTTSPGSFNYHIDRPGNPGYGIFVGKDGDIIRVLEREAGVEHYYWLNLGDNTIMHTTHLNGRDVTQPNIIYQAGTSGYLAGILNQIRLLETALSYSPTQQQQDDINTLLSDLNLRRLANEGIVGTVNQQIFTRAPSPYNGQLYDYQTVVQVVWPNVRVLYSNAEGDRPRDSSVRYTMGNEGEITVRYFPYRPQDVTIYPAGSQGAIYWINLMLTSVNDTLTYNIRPHDANTLGDLLYAKELLESLLP